MVLAGIAAGRIGIRRAEAEQKQALTFCAAEITRATLYPRGRRGWHARRANMLVALGEPAY